MECYSRAVVSNYWRTRCDSRLPTGDDEAAHISDIEVLVPLQVIRDADGNWGLITCTVPRRVT